jgi:hypothetical protein
MELQCLSTADLLFRVHNRIKIHREGRFELPVMQKAGD